MNQILVADKVEEIFTDMLVNQFAAVVLRGFDLTKRYLHDPELSSGMNPELIPTLRRVCVNKLLHDFAAAREDMSARYTTNKAKNSYFAQLRIGPFILTCHHVLSLRMPPRHAKYRESLAQLNMFSEAFPELAPDFEENGIYANLVFSGKHDNLTGIGLGIPDQQTKGWHYFKILPIVPQVPQAEIEDTDREILLGIKEQFSKEGSPAKKRKAEG